MSDLVKIARTYVPFQTTHFDGCEREHIECLVQRMADEIERLTAELETERMRLAACGVVALANTQTSAAKAREMLPEYRSASLTGVERAVDREMKLRAERDEARAERDALRIELDVCRSAIEDCYDIVETFDCYNDSDDACQRATLRRLNEAIGKAAPRLLRERPEGQKLYGLRYRELMAEREVLRTLLIRARDMLDWVGGSCEGIDKTVQMVEAFQAEIDAQIEKERSDE